MPANLSTNRPVPDEAGRSWHARSAGAAPAAHRSRREGFCGQDVVERISVQRLSLLPKQSGLGPVERFARQIDNLLVLVLFAAAAIAGIPGQLVGMVDVPAVVAMHAAIVSFQNCCLEPALAALADRG